MCKLSVGICAYNEEQNIGYLLENLLTEQDLPYDSEIIVVCSGCTDLTPEIVSQFAEKDQRINLIVEPTRNGKAPALNRILGQYHGNVFIHLDADHLPSSGAFPLLLNELSKPGIGAVSGCQIPFGGDNLMDKVNKVVWGLHNYAQRYCNDKGVAQHLGGVLFAIRRGICDHVPEDIVNDDAYMGVKCRQKGYLIHFSDKAKAYFQAPRKVSEYVAQRRRVVFGHLRVKEVTGISPMVLEMCPLKDKIVIISNWVRTHWKMLPYFVMALTLELYVNVIAMWDTLKEENPHKIWKVAYTSKGKVKEDVDDTKQGSVRRKEHVNF
jgi:cellulose synthase/poly-beta-1,6-N-acetylglucosamine synthase-like glycosyltransferase